MPDWSQLLQTFGLAVMILFAVGYAIWKMSKWVGEEIIIPLRDRILLRMESLMTTIDSTLVKLNANVDAMLALARRQASAIVAQTHSVVEQARSVKNAVQEVRDSIQQSPKPTDQSPQD